MKNVKRTVAAGLAATMLLSTVTGCGAGKDEGNQNPASTDGKDAITLQVYGAQGYPGTFTSGVQEDPVFKAIEEKTGVKLDWDFNISDDKYNAYVASGDVPDIFVLSSPKDASALIKSGAVMDLTEYVDEYLPDVKKIGEKALEFSKEYMSDGTDNVYFIPGRITIGEEDSVYMNPVVGFFMRLDYYKEVGSPEIKSFNDVVDVAEAIHELHPTTEDGLPTYAFSMFQNWGLWYYFVASEQIRGMGSLGNGRVAFTDSNLSFIDGLMDDNSPVWVDSAMYNRAYRKGLIDPNSFTQTDAQATTAMDNGQVIVQLASWLTDAPNAALAAANPDNKDAGYVSILVDGVNYSSGTYNPAGFNQYWCISSKCKNPERALEVINYFYTEEGSRTLLCGAKGDTWDEDENGKAYLTEKGRTMKENSDWMNTTGARKLQNYTGIDVYSKDFDGQFIDLFYEPEEQEKTLTDVKKSWLEFYGAESENELWQNNGGTVGNTVFSNLLPAMPSDIARIDTKIESYMTTAMPALVMAEDDAAYNAQKEKMIAEVTAIEGYEEYMDWWKNAVEETAAKAAEFK